MDVDFFDCDGNLLKIKLPELRIRKPMNFKATDAYMEVGGRKRMEQVFEDTEHTEKNH